MATANIRIDDEIEARWEKITTAMVSLAMISFVTPSSKNSRNWKTSMPWRPA